MRGGQRSSDRRARKSILLVCSLLSFLLCLTFASTFASAHEEGSVEGVHSVGEAEATGLETELEAGISEADTQALLEELDLSEIATPPEKRIKAFSGIDRYETNAQQALAGWDSSTWAILAAGRSWADALSVAGLAGALDCPILLVERDSIPAATRSALQALGVQQVIIVGGTGVVSQQVESQLEGLGIVLEARLGGQDRYATQDLIYRYGLERGYWGSVIALASGVDFADALSVAPIAYTTQAPIFLVDDNKCLKDQQVQEILQAVRAGQVDTALVLGGTGRIDEYTEGLVTGMVSAAGGFAYRLAGNTRYQTSVQVARWGVEQGILSWDGSAFATGSSPYDALGGGALQGKTGSTLLLVDDYKQGPACAALRTAQPSYIRCFGGKGAVSMQLRMEAADQLGWGYASIEGFKVYLTAGHGWNSSNDGRYDSGAVGNGYTEAALNKEQANLVGAILRDTYGMDVYINDDGGWYKRRMQQAIDQGCDMMVCFHFNAGGGVTGSQTIIDGVMPAWKSPALQGKVHAALLSTLGLRDLGKVTRYDLYTIRGALPAVLLETCFIDNANDMRVYQSRKAQLAANIARAIAL